MTTFCSNGKSSAVNDLGVPFPMSTTEPMILTGEIRTSAAGGDEVNVASFPTAFPLPEVPFETGLVAFFLEARRRANKFWLLLLL